MKYLEIPVTIPKSFYSNVENQVRGDVKFPKGDYNLYLNVPFGLAASAKWLIQNTIGTLITVQDSYVIINKVEDIETDLLKINITIASPAFAVILAMIAGVGVITTFVLMKVERVIKIAYPLLIGVGGLIIIRTFRVPLVAVAKKAVT